MLVISFGGNGKLCTGNCWGGGLMIMSETKNIMETKYLRTHFNNYEWSRGMYLNRKITEMKSHKSPSRQS